MSLSIYVVISEPYRRKELIEEAGRKLIKTAVATEEWNQQQTDSRDD